MAGDQHGTSGFGDGRAGDDADGRTVDGEAGDARAAEGRAADGRAGSGGSGTGGTGGRPDAPGGRPGDEPVDRAGTGAGPSPAGNPYRPEPGWSRPDPLQGVRPEPPEPSGTPWTPGTTYGPPGTPPGAAGAPPAPPAPYGTPDTPGNPYGPPAQPHGMPAGGGLHVPPMPPAPPPAPADGPRAAAVALLNLSGLGLGYVLVRRRLAALLCCAATAGLLLVALPADPDGVPAFALVLYAVLLLAAAAHGAAVGLRTRLSWPPRTPLALALGVLLLAVPAGGAVLYDGARDEATERMLLDRLDRADHLVEAASEQPFEKARADYRRALNAYDALAADHPGSRAADRVPDRLHDFYTTVGAPYARGRYCDAVPALTFLRTVPRTVDREQLGPLTRWPDDRLATSLYRCASDGLTSGDAEWPGLFGDLLTTFPRSAQAARVEPAVRSAVDKAADAVDGKEPCTAVSRLEGLSAQITGLPGEKAGVDEALAKDADRAGRGADEGAYACGVDEYKDKDFDAALKSINDFLKNNKHHKNRARAQKIAIAAEVAQTVPDAGKRLPTTASGGSISVTVKNDSPDDIRVLYTGPVTGSFTLEGCGGCTEYDWGSTLTPGFEPCGKSGRHYPQRTITLPAGTTYFVHKARSGSTTTTPSSDTARLRPGYIYTECAYTTRGLGAGTGLGTGTGSDV